MTRILFNLNLYNEKKKVANLDDLKENFNLDDILDLYKTNELQSWLEPRLKKIDNEYSEIENKISKLDPSSKDDELMFELYKIFFPHKQENDENIKNTIKTILESREKRKSTYENYKKYDDEIKITIDTRIPQYLNDVNKLVNIGGKKFKETFDFIEKIDNNFIQLFKLQCASLFHELCENDCCFALLGFLTFDKLRRIVLDKSDKLTGYLWKDNYVSVTNFCELFVKKYHKKNKEYDKIIDVKKINNIFVNDKRIEEIESNGEFLILNIPANCKVKNFNNEPILVGNICKGKLRLSSSRNLNTFIKNDSITRQLHYIKIR